MSLATHRAHSEDSDQTRLMPKAELSLHWAHRSFLSCSVHKSAPVDKEFNYYAADLNDDYCFKPLFLAVYLKF